MMGSLSLLSQSGHLIAALACGWLVLRGYQWSRRRSAVVGAIVAVAIIGRVSAGLALFWISFLRLPVAESLQMGNGFWLIAPDATGYYQMAVRVLDLGPPFPLDPAVPAPFFVKTLAAWMFVVGVSPASGMFLNLCLYVALVVTVVWCFSPVNDWRRDFPCIVGVAAYSFAPVVLIHSTQPLKDELSSVLVALGCFGVLFARRLLYGPRALQDLRGIAAGAFALTVATFGIAGIRWYNAIIILGAVLLLIAICAFRWRPAALPRYLAGSFVLFMAAWFGFSGGAGPDYYDVIGANLSRVLAWEPPSRFTSTEVVRSGGTAIKRIAAIPSDLMNLAKVSRTGFLTSGGNTNIVVPLREDADAGLSQSRRSDAGLRATAAYQKKLAEVRGPPVLESRIPSLTLVGALVPITLETVKQHRAAEPYGKATPSQSASPSALPSAPPSATRSAPPAAREFRGVPITVRDQLTTAATGIGIVFVPISLLREVVGIEMSGGGGLLAIADLDTLFLDATTCLVLALLWKRRRAIGDRLPFVLFVLILATTTAMLLGYVVTNYGTLLRLRTMVAVPLWVLVVALSPRAGMHAGPSAIDPDRAPAAT